MSAHSFEMSGVWDLSVINRKLETIHEDEEIHQGTNIATGATAGAKAAEDDEDIYSYSPVLKPGLAKAEFVMNPEKAEQILQDRLAEYYSSREYRDPTGVSALVTLLLGPVISVGLCLLCTFWSARVSIGKASNVESQNKMRMQFEASKSGIGIGLVSSALIYVAFAVCLGWDLWSIYVQQQSKSIPNESVLSLQRIRSLEIMLLSLFACLYFAVGLVLIRSATCKLRELLKLNLPEKQEAGARVVTEKSQTATMTELPDSPIPL